MAMRGECIMKILLPDPMVDHRNKAKREVTEKFAAMAAPLERVHARKRQLAEMVMAGQSLPDDHPFVIEAKERGLPPEEFARDVLGMPDVTLESDRREYERQRFMIKIEAAKTPGEISEILYEAFPFAN